MTIQFLVEAPDRKSAWMVTEEINQKHLRGLATTRSAHEETDEDVEGAIAVNEPIKPKLYIY